MRVQVSPKTAAAAGPLVIDISSMLVAGQVLGLVTVAVTVYSGTDVTPPAFTGSASGTNLTVNQSGGVEGVIYQVVASIATTSPTATLQVSYFLAILPALP